MQNTQFFDTPQGLVENFPADSESFAGTYNPSRRPQTEKNMKNIENLTFQNQGFGKTPSSRLDSHRNSMQNGMVERFTAFMATIFVANFNFYAAATFCPLDGNGKKEQNN